MSVFKCKMCGGNLEVTEGMTVCECEYCGTNQTVPRLDSERKSNLYDRANHFRRNNDFDKAIGIYEQILNEDNADAEAYWSLVLCRYGIEYVEDPKTHKRIPTVNRAQFTSIYMDEDYKSALKYADTYQKSIYEEEAKAIDDIQKGILDISSKEEPFDVFICYKETDKDGRRTQDSVLANELYHQLTNEGFKVFFSRITLEDKLGVAYEPYIFAALNSAKVMVVIGTRQEYFNAVWVKNEWSRYLALVRQSGGKKTLIPAYRDMDPYDLPEEFSHLQAQDMSKLGFMQDLIRGIKKVTREDSPKEVTKETVVISGNSNVKPLLKRAFMFLEDGEWAKADEYCENVLNQDPENAQAYLGKMLADLQVKSQEELSKYEYPLDKSGNYQKAIRFGDDQLAGMLTGYNEQIKERIENKRLKGIYDKAYSAMRSARTPQDFKSAAATFRTIRRFQDAEELEKKCIINANKYIYRNAKSVMDKSYTVADYQSALQLFNSISGWQDADEQIFICQSKIDEIRQMKEAANLHMRKVFNRSMIVILIVGVIVAAVYFTKKNIIPELEYKKRKKRYDSAMELYESQQYEEAYEAFVSMDFEDSDDMAEKCLFMKQKSLISDVSVGSTIRFGYYEQDNDLTNGSEEIEWKVLAVDGSKVLLISKYALDCQRYDAALSSWTIASLRSWLKQDFYYEAFGTNHREIIIEQDTITDDNPEYITGKVSKKTNDKVFLLSMDEANTYFGSEVDRKCKATTYCLEQGAACNSNGYCWWWLRTRGNADEYCSLVNTDGSIYAYGNHVDNEEGAVRPAMWIKLEE